jgi:hypothetical protein
LSEDWPVTGSNTEDHHAQMRFSRRPRGLLIYCADYRCSHSIALSGGPEFQNSEE